MLDFAPRHSPRLLARLIRVDRGNHVVSPGPDHRLILHCGSPVFATSIADGVTAGRHLQRDGDMDFIPAGTSGWWRDEAPSTVLALTLSPSLFREAGRRMGCSSRALEPRPWLHRRDEPLASLARMAPRAGDETTPGALAFGEAVGKAMALRILILGGDALPRTTRVRPLDGRRLRAVLAHIDENIDQPLTLDRLAGVAGLRRSHFAAAFRLATRLPPRQFIIRRRVEIACALLARNAGSISEVAFRTGFAHQSHLARAMRTITGLTPRDIGSAATALPSRSLGPAPAAALRPPPEAGEEYLQQFPLNEWSDEPIVGRSGFPADEPARPVRADLLR